MRHRHRHIDHSPVIRAGEIKLLESVPEDASSGRILEHYWRCVVIGAPQPTSKLDEKLNYSAKEEKCIGMINEPEL